MSSLVGSGIDDRAWAVTERAILLLNTTDVFLYYKLACVVAFFPLLECHFATHGNIISHKDLRKLLQVNEFFEASVRTI